MDSARSMVRRGQPGICRPGPGWLCTAALLLLALCASYTPSAAAAAAPSPAAAAGSPGSAVPAGATARATGDSGGARGVRVDLRAKWQATPWLLEAAEFLAEEDPALFWRFLEAWAGRPGGGGEGGAPAAPCWDQVLAVAGQLLSPAMTKVLAVVVASRQYSPRLELFRTLLAQAAPALPQGACCVAEVSGKLASSAAELSSLLDAARAAPGGAGNASMLFPFDHVYGGAAPAAAPITAILYGAPGTPCFAELHQALAAAAAPGAGGKGDAAIAYAVRPLLLAEGCGGADECVEAGAGAALALPGWWAELAVKNTEYNAQDDAAKGQEGKDDQPGPSQVAGFDFDRLLARKPELAEELAAFRDHLAAASNQEDVLKAWDLKDLGLQAAQRIAKAGDPLALAAQLAGDFPALAGGLSRGPVAEPLRSEVARNQKALAAGSSLLMVNGLLVDLPSATLFSLVDRLRHEVRLADKLGAAGLEGEDVAALMALRGGGGAGPGGGSGGGGEPRDVRLNLTHPQHVHFVNDLEKDRAYRRWSPAVTDLLMPSFGGGLRQIRRNMFNVIFVVDPGTAGGARAARLLWQLYRDQYPLRCGLVLAPSGIAADWEAASASDRAARAFLTLESAFGAPAAFRFLAALADAVDDSSAPLPEATQLSWEQVEDAFNDIWDSVGLKALDKKEPTSAEAAAAKLSAADARKQLQAGEGFSAESAAGAAASAAWARAAGVARLGPATLVMNGAVQAAAAGVSWQHALMYALQVEMGRMQEWLYYRHIDDGTQDVLAAILARASVVPRHNPRVLPLDTDDSAAPRLVDIGAGGGLSLRAAPLSQLGYLHPPGTQDEFKPITHWVVADVGAPEGRALVLEALRHLAQSVPEAAPDSELALELGMLDSSAGARVGVLHNPGGGAGGELARVVLAATELGSRRAKIPGFLLQLLANETLLSAAGEEELRRGALGAAQAAGLNTQALAAALADGGALDARLAAHARLVTEELRLAAGAGAVITNGRVVTAVPEAPAAEVAQPDGTGAAQLGAVAEEEGDGLVAEDFVLMEIHARTSQAAEGIMDILTDALDAGRLRIGSGDGSESDEDLGAEALSDAALVASSTLALHGLSGNMKVGNSERVAATLQSLGAQHSAVVLPPAPGAPPLAVAAVINPLTNTAQKVVPLLEWLRAALGFGLRLHLNPERDLSDLPLKSFYRAALPEWTPGANGLPGEPSAPAARFASLPARRVLTLNMDVPEAWLVEGVAAEHDLDNIELAKLELGPGDHGLLRAEFELEALLLTGSCVDAAARTRDQVHPRGVQLHLGTAGQSRVTDTLVMSNLGYFQLQAAPGAWSLALAPGRSRQLYAISSATGISEGQMQTVVQADQAGADLDTPVVIGSLAGHHMYLRLRKRPGMEKEDVLAPEEAPASAAWSKAMSWLGGGGGGGAAAKERALAQPAEGEEDNENTIHMFTVASGHMYERLQKIMILSVLRNTKTHVKFWFIKNYMSPQMRAFIPHMAREYGFDYQFVTYKWPSWLHKQTEKQRIIWAYKILFLDVLFPLSLRKVIFVDADQVVRADMRELWDMDLQGAPLAYTPFCDNNKAMDGFRFWKQGFWQEHLRGKPYHISALYVVDLARFRQLAAGDQLRVIYDQLSKDPHSLANLDQDLPNYSQHSVPIFSLPQEWLWCETWCGRETQAAAKTIDLCNNPLTKEPKLDNARRLVPEWPALDAEARAFTDKVLQQQRAGTLPPVASGPQASGSTAPPAADHSEL